MNNNFKPSKSMGQNFLNDPNISRKIVRLSGIDKTCGVLEVGPGYGAITKLLAEAAGHVTAVELDKRLFEHLRGTLCNYPNVTFVQGDILKQNLRELADNTLPEQSRHICANLPYNITTPAITKFIESKVFETITVMVQKEVALRMCADSETPDYGAFTVFVNYHAAPAILFDISPECFTPRPKVTSAVVKMTLFKEPKLPPEKEKLLFKIVRAAFGQRRKTLTNALYASFSETHSKESIITAIESCGFDAKIRGEALSLDEYIKLTSIL